MKKIATTIGLIAAFTFAGAGCAKDKNDEGKKGTAAGKVTAKTSGPIVMTSASFHKDYTSRTGPQVMKKYMNKKVRISGPLQRTMDMGEYGGYQVWLDAVGKTHVAVKFSDDGVAAKGKGLKKGAPVTVECRIGGMMGKNIHLIDCDLRG